MKDIRPALRALLLDDGAVAALVGGQRVYPVQLEQGQTSPSLVYHRVTEVADYHMQGPSGLVQITLQLDAWATTQSGAVELADAAYDRLSGFSGLIDLGLATPVQVHGIFMIAGREDYDDVSKLFRVSRDYAIAYWAD